MEKYSPLLAAVGRALIAIVFIMSGISKLADPSGTQGFIASVGLPAPQLGYLVALAVEIGGGMLLLVGYQTRISAAALALFTLATAFFFHRDFADQNQMIHFLKNLMVAGGLLQVAAPGASAYGFDGRRLVKRTARQ